MPRSPRAKSFTNTYHIIIRGINRQDIFLDNQDFKKMLKEIKKIKEKYKYNLYAYVLMPNHIHLMINSQNEDVSKVVQSLNIRYTQYFNSKYERIGHLFQDRFRSKAVEDEGYFRDLVRYIHKNPQNAGLKDEYPWTSYYEYVYQNDGITDKNAVMKLFQNDIQYFKEFHKNYRNKYINVDYEMVNRIEDKEAIQIMKELSNEENLMKIQNYGIKEKYSLIKQFTKIEGITKVQIARILGINKKTVERIEKMSL